MPDQPLTYLSAGVNIDEAERALRSVSAAVKSTYTDSVIGGIGGFGSLFRADFSGLTGPILVASIDGVGTKTKVAGMVGAFRGLGHDIVNHCVNDILCQGARPLFFLDYFGTSRLQGLQFEEVLHGMTEACLALELPLVGGETAELPGVYVDDEFDVVGAIVGLVDHDGRLPRGKPKPGDAILGLASDGLHTNGFSLARRALFEVGGLSVRDEVPGLGTTIGEELLRPHRCYFRSIFPLLQETDRIYALAHITGGGLYDNVPRVLPTDMRAILERRSWTAPPLFRLIQAVGNVPDGEMHRTFNMGIGMVMVVDRDAAPGILQRLHQSGESAAIIGEVQPGGHEVQIV